MTNPAPSIPAENPAPLAPALAPAPQPSGGWATQLARLTGWELFLAWRRRGMVITLSVLLLIVYIICVLFVGFLWLEDSAVNGAGQSVYTSDLVYPGSISFAGGVFTDVGVLLLMVLVGALIGSDYAYGVHRLSLARGVGRGQLLAAQIIALALLALISSAVMLLLGALVGGVGSLMIGFGSAVTLAGVGELIIYWLAVALNAFVYSLIGLCVGTLGRSVAAAIAGPLVYIFVEFIATETLTLLLYIIRPSLLRNLVAGIPGYLLGFNTSAVMQLSLKAPYQLASSSDQIGWLHALLVILFYCAAMIIVTYTFFRSRDVRE